MSPADMKEMRARYHQHKESTPAKETPEAKPSSPVKALALSLAVSLSQDDASFLSADSEHEGASMPAAPMSRHAGTPPSRAAAAAGGMKAASMILRIEPTPEPTPEPPPEPEEPFDEDLKHQVAGAIDAEPGAEAEPESGPKSEAEPEPEPESEPEPEPASEPELEPKSEMNANKLKHEFTRYDTDKDGLLSAAEAKAMMLDLGFDEPDDKYMFKLGRLFGMVKWDGSGRQQAFIHSASPL